MSDDSLIKQIVFTTMVGKNEEDRKDRQTT